MSRTLDVRVASMQSFNATESLTFSEDIEALTQEQRDALMVALRPRVEELRDLVRMVVQAAQDETQLDLNRLQQLDFDSLQQHAERIPR